jgi:hypothetical protein
MMNEYFFLHKQKKKIIELYLYDKQDENDLFFLYVFEIICLMRFVYKY